MPETRGPWPPQTRLQVMGDEDCGSLVGLRKMMGLSQREMAKHVGMSLRAYHDIETGHTAYRLTHRLAAERAALALAVARGDPTLAPAELQRQAIALAELIRRDADRTK